MWCFRGESVFTNHLIGAQFVVCFKEPTVAGSGPLSNESSPKMNLTDLDVAAALCLRVAGGGFVWILPCFAEIVMCARHF